MIRQNKKIALVAIFFCSLPPLVEAQISGQLQENSMLITEPEKADVVLLGKSNIGFIGDLRVLINDQVLGEGPGPLRTVTAASLDSELLPTRPGVVFNYSMQAYGLVSGEIAFAVKTATEINSMAWGGTARPRPLGPPGVFVLNVRTGSEFIRVMSMLLSTSAVEWVEPSVAYIPESVER